MKSCPHCGAPPMDPVLLAYLIATVGLKPPKKKRARKAKR